MAKNSGIIVGSVHFSKNKNDGHTLSETIKQTTEMVGLNRRWLFVTRFPGKSFVNGMKVVIPKSPGKRSATLEKQNARKRFRRLSDVKLTIGHLKSDFRLMRNYLKWSLGYSINLMLANATLNFRKLLRQLLDCLLLFLMADQGRLFRKILKGG